MPISLTDDELLIVMSAARPLTPPDRDRFLRDVAAELECYREIGPGIVARVVRETQRKVFAPPILGSKAVGKYGR